MLELINNKNVVCNKFSVGLVLCTCTDMTLIKCSFLANRRFSDVKLTRNRDKDMRAGLGNNLEVAFVS